jgi:transglutaminase-like putative cysteine protease
VETFLPDLGWVGFDPTNGLSTSEAYLRVAVGLDYLDAAPVRGARRGGGAETMIVSVTASDSTGSGSTARPQAQSQVQA